MRIKYEMAEKLFYSLVDRAYWERVSKAKEPDVVKQKREIIEKMSAAGVSSRMISRIMGCTHSAVNYLHTGRR